jgi:dipeptidyl-peptidase-4
VAGRAKWWPAGARWWPAAERRAHGGPYGPGGTAASAAAEVAATSDEEFPRRYARTRRFSLGRPRPVRLAPDGSRLVFLRSFGPTEPLTGLWVLDLPAGVERLVGDPQRLLGDGSADEPAEDRARRERLREQSTGIVACAVDRAVRRAAVTLAGRLFLVDLVSGDWVEVPTAGPAVEATPAPAGDAVAYVSGGALHVRAGDVDRCLAEPDGPDVTWGLAEFIAAEEMDRFRGYWWAPDGGALLVARVQETDIPRWHLSDPTDPTRPPREVRYPVAGGPNADVTLHRIDLAGGRTQLRWDAAEWPYLAAVSWSGSGPPLVTVQTRDQRRLRILTVSEDGATQVREEVSDPHWVDLVSETPAWLGDGRLVTTGWRGGLQRLLVDGEPVSPPDATVTQVLEVGDAHALFSASMDGVSEHLWRWQPDDGLARLTEHGGNYLYAASAAGHLVWRDSGFDRDTALLVSTDGEQTIVVQSLVELPEPADVHVLSSDGGPRVAVVLPSGHDGSPLPVLLMPYGGPGHREVVDTRDQWYVKRWFADQGFAVVVVDGRGTPGGDYEWDRAIANDLANTVLADQVSGLQLAAAQFPVLDLSRVGITGASFGGYLAALSVLRRPDVFHAAVATAPVSDWRLYDTHYTERYLGLPAEQEENYRRCSLVLDAEKLRRPLLLMHGFHDDNVYMAHTLQLSAALLAAGRMHSVLPIPGGSHALSSEEVAEGMLRIQAEFLLANLS